MEQILLYHYSTTKYSELKTRESQGVKVETEVSPRVHRPGNYNQHISFFMDPIPAKTMTSIFGVGHPVWFSGNRLVEHVIDLRQIGAFKYHVVETPEKTVILYDNDIDDTEFYRLLNKLNRDHGYIGEGVRDFMKPYRRFKGATKKYFLRANTYPDWESNKTKYAANVPHVMLYPASGTVSVLKTSEVIIS